MLTVPKAEYHIGDRVWVKCTEAGLSPEYEATICCISANPRRSNRPEYAVIEDDGLVTDGYEESSFRPASNL